MNTRCSVFAVGAAGQRDHGQDACLLRVQGHETTQPYWLVGLLGVVQQ